MGQNYTGERFGDYKLVRPLGEGGFASVYLGEEVRKGTPAAVKLPKEQQVHDFINEVRRTFRLRNPNIIEILDFGIRTPDNTAFIIMEYAPNGTFRQKYPRGTRVPLNVVVPTVKQVASALQYAHDQRVIHRDVKPENLLLNARNMVLLSDFGIATASRTTMTANAGQAGQGDIIGTYAYMSPEQLKGRPVTVSDQYSLAIMVYEWLCGALPFEAREYIQWHYLHEKVPPPSLREHVPSLASDVEQVVLRALAKRPEERFERVEKFAIALEQAARGEDVSAAMNAPGPTQFESTPIGRPSPTPSNSIEQLFQEGVRAQASGKTEEAFRIWRQVMMTSGVAEKYSTTARNRIRELRAQMIPLRLKQAREASIQGRWQDEIRLWEDLLALEPSAQDLTPLLKSPLTLGKETSNLTQSIQERLQIARENEQAAWMYEEAQQFIHNQDNAAARTQLEMLWNDASYYGDIASLAKMVGLPAVLNYEQAIAAEQARLEQERQEQERQKQLRQYQAQQEQERQKRLGQEQAQQEQARLRRLRQKQAQRELKRDRPILFILSMIVVTALIMGGGALGGLVGKIIGAIIGGIVGGIVGVGITGGEIEAADIDGIVSGEIAAGVIILIIEMMVGGGITGGMIGGTVGAITGAVAGAVAGAGGAFVGLIIAMIGGMSGIMGRILGEAVIGAIAGAVAGGAIIGRGIIVEGIMVGGTIIGAIAGVVASVIIGGMITVLLRNIARRIKRNS